MVSPNTSWITGEWETQNISHLQELNEFSSVGLKVYVIYLMNILCTNRVQNRHMPVKSPISVLSKPFGCDGIQGHFFPTLSFLALNPLFPPPNCFCPTPQKMRAHHLLPTNCSPFYISTFSNPRTTCQSQAPELFLPGTDVFCPNYPRKLLMC